jgi:ankyrin repeat protein
MFIDVNYKSDTGETPLLVASYNGNSLVIQELLNNGAGTDIQNEDGDSPLLFAVKNFGQHNDLESVELLLNKGADVNLVNKYGENVMKLAQGYEKMLSLLRNNSQRSIA